MKIAAPLGFEAPAKWADKSAHGSRVISKSSFELPRGVVMMVSPVRGAKRSVNPP